LDEIKALTMNEFKALERYFKKRQAEEKRQARKR